MERLSFDADAAFSPRDERLEGVAVAPLTASIFAGSPFQAAVFRLAPGGRIARYPADVQGEEHETTSASARRALVVEGDGLELFRR